jgi:hypothetical protein
MQPIKAWTDAMDTDFLPQNKVDIRRRCVRFTAIAMKCGMINAVLTFALGVLAVAGVILMLRTVIQARELRTITPQAASANGFLSQAQLLLNDVSAYNQKNPSPELAKLLQSVQPKPAAPKPAITN